MNKLFTKIATAFVGIAMAIGVGVAIGSNNYFGVSAEVGTDSSSFNMANTTEATDGDGIKWGVSAGTATTTASKHLQFASGYIYNKTAISVDKSYGVKFEITARKYGGPTAAQGTLTLDIYSAATGGTSLVKATKTIAPTSTSLVSYTSDELEFDNKTGSANVFFRIIAGSSDAGKCAAVSSITVKYEKAGAVQNYTVNFNSNSGTGGSMSPATTSGSSYTTPACGFTRTNYIFSKWALNGASGTQYDVGSTITNISDDITLWAIWVPASDVTYKVGDHGIGSDHVVTVATGSSHQLLAYGTGGAGFTASTGWAFTKWKIDQTQYSAGTSVTISGTTTVTAQYEEVHDYTLVTDASKLKDGTTFVLAHQSTNTIGIGAWSSSYFTTTTISITNNKISSSTNAMVFSLEKSGNYWKVKSGDYYYGLQNSTTALRDGTGSGNNYLWTITITNNIAEMKTLGSSARSLCYNYNNGNTPRYSAYTASSTYTQVRMFAVIPSSGLKVTYDANQATSGSVPEDKNSYSAGDNVTVLGNTGGLSKTNFTWGGWNTKSDGTGDHLSTNSTFEISDDITLYAEWVKSLDAITSIGGTIRASVTNAGTTKWDYTDVTVTGTLSGLTGQDVKSYVDLSTTTLIPGVAGECTASVTATKKQDIPGSASSLNEPALSGMVEVVKLTYTFTMSYSDLQSGASYATEDNRIKESTAACQGHDPITINWRTSNVIYNNNSGTKTMQFKAGLGYLYNTTEIPGTITGVSFNDSVVDGSFTTYYGNTENPSTSTTVGGKYFAIHVGDSAGHVESITVSFEVSDKPKVQLVASDINTDVASGIISATVTDGSSAVTGYHLESADPYIALITNDERIQPTGYGKVVVSVTKEEDAGHIYLATSFIVRVGDSSKEDSVMEFVEKAGGSATADDGVVWTINSGSVKENDFDAVFGINYGTNNDKISSLILSTPADDNRIIKNVVVEAMSGDTGSTIAVNVGGTSFTCSKSTDLTGNVVTYNFAGNKSGEIVITMSGTPASRKYGVKSISVLYVGDEATSFASTFLSAISCDNDGIDKPSFNFKEGQTRWTWALLETEFGKLSLEDRGKFAPNAGSVNATILECVARYDYIVGKYFVGGKDKTLISSDFMSRSPSPVGSGRILLPLLEKQNSNSLLTVTIILVISAVSVGGYFFLRKKKED